MREGKHEGRGLAVRKDAASHDDRRQQHKCRAGRQRIDDVLKELLVQCSVQFPQLKIVIIGPTDEIQAGSH
jgi:hypothetical protein